MNKKTIIFAAAAIAMSGIIIKTRAEAALSTYGTSRRQATAAPAPSQTEDIVITRALKCAMSVNGGAAAGMCNGACGGFANPEAFMAQQCQNCLDSYTSNYKTCLQQ